MKVPSSAKVIIVVLNWNGMEDTTRCLLSLRELAYPNFETVVVDNGSTGGDADLLQDGFPGEILLIRNAANLGYSAGNNVGMEAALHRGADYVLILNNDTTVDREFLSQLVAVAEDEPRVGIVGPKTYYMDPSDLIWAAGGKLNWYFEHSLRGQRERDVGQYESSWECDFLPGSCLLIKREVIEQIGYLPTDYFLQWEDIDYCTAARRKGFTCVYVPKARIWHRVSASPAFQGSARVRAAVARGIRNRIHFRRKYMSNAQFMLFVLCFAFVTLPSYVAYYLIVYRDWRRVMSLLRGAAAGLRAAAKRRPPLAGT